MLVTLATGDAGLVAAGWLAAWLPAGCAAAGWDAAGWDAAGWDAAGWVWADGPWLLPRPWVALLTVPVTLLTAPARPLVAGGGELAAWLAGCAVLGWTGAVWVGAGWTGAVWVGAGWTEAGCDELACVEADWAEPDGGGLAWVRLCTAPLAVPVRELSADPAPLAPEAPGVPDDPGSVAAEARPTRRNAKMSAAAIPPQTHKVTLRARPKARARVADPSTARRLHGVPIIIHTYPPVLSGQNSRCDRLERLAA